MIKLGGLGIPVADPLIVLLLLDLFNLIKQLSNSQLELSEFVLGCNFRVVVGMFSNLNIEMHSLQCWENSRVELCF